MHQCVSRCPRTVMSPSPRRPVSRTSPRRLLAALALSTAVLLVPGVAAASGGDDGGSGTTAGAVAGDFAVTVNGRTSNPAAGKEFRVSDTAPSSPVLVSGRHVGF